MVSWDVYLFMELFMSLLYLCFVVLIIGVGCCVGVVIVCILYGIGYDFVLYYCYLVDVV